MDCFEKATRVKLRFETSKGAQSASVEDLWDLPLTSTTGKANLYDIARELHKVTTEVELPFPALTTPKSQVMDRNKLAFEVVQHIMTVRLAENEQAAKARANAQVKSKILEILEEKDTESLKNKSSDELRAIVANL